MIDAVRMVSNINGALITTNDEFIKIGQVILVPVIDHRSFEIIRFEGVLNNLKFVLRGNRLTVSNSLHKFAKRDNYSDFLFTDLVKTVRRIEACTGIKSNDFELTSLEVAINITTDDIPHRYLSLFVNYKGREFDKMRSRSFAYGLKCPLTEYSIKIYDKREQIKRMECIDIGRNILRFEICYHRSRSIHSSVKTLSDLLINDKLYALLDDMIGKLRMIKIKGEEDLSNLSSRERELWFAGKGLSFWDFEKRNNLDTYKSKKKKFKVLENQISFDHTMINWIEKIADKVKFQMNN